MSQIEVSVNDEISALKNAYVEAAGEIEAHARNFNNYNERGKYFKMFPKYFFRSAFLVTIEITSSAIKSSNI